MVGPGYLGDLVSHCLSECRGAAEQAAGLVHRAAGTGNEVPEGYTKTEYDVYLHIICSHLVLTCIQTQHPC